MFLADLKKQKLPDAPGVYFFKLGKEILYIGKATSLKDRVKSYFASDLISTRGPLIVDMVFKADRVDFVQTNSVLEALILENNLIKTHQPRYNTKEKDDRSYYYIVITKEDFPRVLLVRAKELEMGVDYKIRSQFGPYPSASQLKESLNIIRKIFPYRDRCNLNEVKPCFNYQIGLCPGTCFNLISKKDYSKTIKNIELFLSAKTSQLIKKLEKEMAVYAKSKKFEKAKEVRDTIFALQHIQDVSVIASEAKQSREADFRIEAFDAAHLMGTNNVGVMVVWENGELKKSDYRKFKINDSKGNDAGALKEMLERRLKHVDWPAPDLIVVDGNMIQLNIVKKLTNIPVVAVTKDERHKAKALIGDAEAIKNYKKQILLINAEAHRFAIKYHRQLRSKI